MSTSKLSPYAPGSLRELAYIALPLMLSSFSGTAMLFFDRMILAHYSLSAMNAAALAGMSTAVFIFGAVPIAAMSEVFVGQYNGAGQHKDMGKPVWQMVWYALLCNIVFIPVALWAGPALVPHQYEADGVVYFEILMLFAFIQPLNAALAGFFIGQGKVKVITITTVIANVLNLVLDIIFVFGIKGVLPAMGTKGAAIATVFAGATVTITFFYLFLRQKERERYGTGHYQFNKRLFLKCLRLGGPNSVGHIIEISAWALLLHMMAWVSHLHVTAMAVGNSVFVLFVFTTDALQKAVTAIASNFIGSDQWHQLKTVLRSAVKFEVLVILLLAFPLVLYPDLVIKGFLSKSIDPEELRGLKQVTELALIWTWVYFFFDGLTWCIAGILTAAGDTIAIMVINALSAWLFCILPVYIIVVRHHASPIVAWEMIALYGLANFTVFCLRFRTERWRTHRVLQS